jgi:hypothetical protein
MFESPKFKLKLEVATEGGTKHVLAVTLLIAAIAAAAYIILLHR